MEILIKEYVEIVGVFYDLVVEVIRKMVVVKMVVIWFDFGIEMSFNSILNVYLKWLLFLIIGNFNKKGINYLVIWFIFLIGYLRDLGEGGMMIKVIKVREIVKVYLFNVFFLEIDIDYFERFRVLVVDSCNFVFNWVDM